MSTRYLSWLSDRLPQQLSGFGSRILSKIHILDTGNECFLWGPETYSMDVKRPSWRSENKHLANSSKLFKFIFVLLWKAESWSRSGFSKKFGSDPRSDAQRCVLVAFSRVASFVHFSFNEGSAIFRLVSLYDKKPQGNTPTVFTPSSFYFFLEWILFFRFSNSREVFSPRGCPVIYIYLYICTRMSIV